MSQEVLLLGISASPRKEGNSAFLLDAALNFATKFEHANVVVKKFDFAGKKIGPCLACYGCIDSKGKCLVQDDFHELRALWLWSDAVIYSVPVFAMSLPSQLKGFFDRLCNTLVFDEAETPKRLKVVGTISQGMHFAAGQETAIREILNLSVLLGCLPVAGAGYSSYNGVRGWTFNKLSRSTLRKRLASDDESVKELVGEVESLTRHILYTALIVKEGATACKDVLSQEYGSLLQRIRGGNDAQNGS